MNLSVFGLGYVGCVSAACFAREGHHVIGIDVNPDKIDMINAGHSTIVEEGIAELVAEVVKSGRLRATMDIEDSVRNSEMSIICVGTPSRPNGSIDLSYIERVCREIGTVLRHKSDPHLVVIRSTVLPGTIEQVVIPALEDSSGRRRHDGWDVTSHPEFLREGSSIRDFYEPPFTLIGSDDKDSADRVAALYSGIDAPVHVVSIRAAEMVKYACNAFHGLKVSFANEIGNICKALAIDSHDVMRVFCEDTKLNISPAYLKPGFAFGGSCLPKDVRALTYRARQLDLDTPVLAATLESNRRQIERAVDMVLSAGNRRVGILGLSFKEGTDDLRESPMVALVEALIGKGMQLSIYDANVAQGGLLGSNREFIERHIPHIWSLMRPTVKDVLSESNTVVLGNRAPEFRDMPELSGNGHVIVDLARAVTGRTSSSPGYEGVCW